MCDECKEHLHRQLQFTKKSFLLPFSFTVNIYLFLPVLPKNPVKLSWPAWTKHKALIFSKEDVQWSSRIEHTREGFRLICEFKPHCLCGWGHIDLSA